METNLNRFIVVMKGIYFLFLASLALPACAQKNKSNPIELKPGTIISGRVIDSATNEPLGPHAMIIETVDNDTAAYYYTVTDKDGRFSYPLFGTDRVLVVLYNGYKKVKVPLDKTDFEIKLEKAPAGYKKEGVMYQLLEDYRGHANTLIDKTSDTRVPNIRVVKPEELTNDGEGILIEDIE